MENLVDGKVITSFWRGKRVLITGHTGFKGAWLSAWLNKLGSKVTGIALAPQGSPNVFQQIGLETKLDHHICDIRNAASLHDIFRQSQPEILFHLAAQPLVLSSYEDPTTTWDTNVLGTLNVLEAARRISSLKAVVVITTDKVYKNFEWNYAYRENDHLGGHDPYSASKAACEILVESHRKSFFSATQIGLASARAGNVFGGGDGADFRLIPDIARALKGCTSIKVRNPDSVRPWQYVLEPLRGYILLAQALCDQPKIFSDGWNFGPRAQDNITVSDLLKKAKDTGLASINIEVERHPAAAHEAGLLMLDSTLATRKLKWAPMFTMEEALAMTFEWYNAWASEKSTQALLEISEKHLDMSMARG